MPSIPELIVGTCQGLEGEKGRGSVVIRLLKRSWKVDSAVVSAYFFCRELQAHMLSVIPGPKHSMPQLKSAGSYKYLDAPKSTNIHT